MGARDVRAGSAYVEVMTKDSTGKGLDGIKGKLRAFGNGIDKIKGVAVGVTTTAGAATAAAVKKAIDTGSAIKDMADRFGLSYVAVQRLGFVADQTGTSIETLAGGIKKMQQGLGNGTLGDELTALGISLSDIQGKSPEQQFAMIATAIGKMTDPAKKTAAAMAIFGKAGSELVPLTGQIQSLMAEFDGLGITMGDAAVEQAEALGDEIDKVSKKFEAMAVKLGTAVLPILERLIKASEGLMPDTSGVSPAFMQGAIDQELFGDNTAMNAAIAASNANAQAFLDRAKAQDEEGKRQSEARREAREAGLPEPGTGNSPLAAWLRRMQAGSVAMNNSAIGRDNLKPVIDSVAKAWERIGRSVERDQNKERIRERRQIQSDLKEVNQQISDAMSKSISFGSFDKRDLLGGVFQDVQHSQLKELRESKKLLEKLLAKKGGLPVGM